MLSGICRAKLKVVHEELNGEIPSFMRYWALEKHFAESGTAATKLIRISSCGQMYLPVRRSWSSPNITYSLREVRDCYRDKIGNDGLVILLVNPTKRIVAA